LTKDENLNKAHVKYLESRLYEIAVEVNRYEISNNSKPTKSSISESEIAEMEEFIEYIRMLINTMNFKVFEPLIKESTGENIKTEELNLKGARGAIGKGKRTTDGFVVLKGSELASSTVPSFPKGFNALREELLESDSVIEEQGRYILSKDILFSSPSAAAVVIMGRSANGLLEWKNNSGKTLKIIEALEIEKANRVRTGLNPALPTTPCMRLRTGRFISRSDSGT